MVVEELLISQVLDSRPQTFSCNDDSSLENQLISQLVFACQASQMFFSILYNYAEPVLRTFCKSASLNIWPAIQFKGIHGNGIKSPKF